MHWAVVKNSDVTLHYLIAYGAVIDVSDIQGFTPLHLAAKNLSKEASTYSIRYLIFSDANKSIMVITFNQLVL